MRSALISTTLQPYCLTKTDVKIHTIMFFLAIFIGNDTRNQLAQACAHQNLKCDKAVLEASFLHNGSHLMLLVFRDNMRDNKGE